MTAIKTKQNALIDFEIESLDAYEIKMYSSYVDNGLDKAEILQLLINDCEGDYTQLSNDLAILAQEIDNL